MRDTQRILWNAFQFSIVRKIYNKNKCKTKGIKEFPRKPFRSYGISKLIILKHRHFQGI